MLSKWLVFGVIADFTLVKCYGPKPVIKFYHSRP
jgi:hypothetical protein